MVREVLRYGDTLLVKVFFAPSMLSGEAIARILESFNIYLAELSVKEGINVFLKRITKERDYWAIIAIETTDFQRAMEIAHKIEDKMRNFARKTKKQILEAIAALRQQ